ncbi:copper chaperone PCu(A)C [Nocardioides gilvus]|uniref:copper chaperone PCu(A)C n=1 Tax=Nocardioides gilvus TaxID=1735589 RepID=UPI001EF4A925|nr:copper chaperone PCu(A)C [Nocardioides gilvus]
MKHLIAVPTPVPHARSRARLGLAALSLVLAAALSACGSEEEAPRTDLQSDVTPSASIVVEDPWVRATEGAEDTSMSAAFMVLDNQGASDVTVTGASSEVAGTVELHDMVMTDGKSVMTRMEGGIEVAAGKGQLLQPGGMHVMLMDLREELAAGDEVTLILTLSDGSEVEVTAPVKEFTEEEGHYHAPGTEEHGH